MKIDFILPDSIKEVYNKLEPVKIDNYWVVDFMFTDIPSGRIEIINPQKVIDLNNLKDLISFWIENKNKTHRLQNGKKVKMYPMAEA